MHTIQIVNKFLFYFFFFFIAAIGRRCMYDSHCITNAYCRKQTVCTCKAEFPLESEDKWFCDGN